jgi:hypothetical protein
VAWKAYVLDKGYNVTVPVTKFRMVKYTGNVEEVGPVSAITDIPAGVNQYDVTAAQILDGKGASVEIWGISEVEASTAITVGTMCTLETDGRVSALVGASGKRIVGRCVGSPAATAGDRISMLVLHGLALA